MQYTWHWILLHYDAFQPVSHILKNKSRLVRSSCCLRIYVPLLTNFLIVEPIFIKPGMYIMVPEPISMAYFVCLSHQSVLTICILSIVARQMLGKDHLSFHCYGMAWLNKVRQQWIQTTKE
jgi:hypothetical protein